MVPAPRKESCSLQGDKGAERLALLAHTFSRASRRAIEGDLQWGGEEGVGPSGVGRQAKH